MKKLLFLPFLLFALLGCDSDDEAEFSIDGIVFRLTNLILESSVDLNNDGIYFSDLLSEIDSNPTIQNCYLQQLRFTDNQQVNNFLCDNILNLEVNYNQEGIPYQSHTCELTGECLRFNYEQKGTSIDFYRVAINTNIETFVCTGELSQNNTIITFSNIEPHMFGRQILKEDGTVEQYTGTVTLIFELED